jgi:hypothetical protein
MLKEEERVADPVRLPRRDHFRLDPETFGIRQAADLEEMDMHEIDEPGAMGGLGIPSGGS